MLSVIKNKKDLDIPPGSHAIPAIGGKPWLPLMSAVTQYGRCEPTQMRTHILHQTLSNSQQENTKNSHANSYTFAYTSKIHIHIVFFIISDAEQVCKKMSTTCSTELQILC